MGGLRASPGPGHLATLPRVRELTDLTLPTRVVARPEEAARALADEVAGLVAADPEVVLGLATGSTPVETYAQLVARTREGLDLSRVRTFNLDEYEGLAAGDPASFRSFMRRHLFGPAGVDPARTRFPVRAAEDETPEDAAARFERAIEEAGGIELQVLGIGGNGHVAFNEPGSPRDSRTRRVELAELTRRVNSVGFLDPERFPTHAMTMGVGTILEARRLRILAFGAHKAGIVARLLRSAPTEELPVTLLAGHPDVVLWIDEAAAAEL